MKAGYLVGCAVLLLAGLGYGAVDVVFTQLDVTKFPIIECYVLVTDGTGTPIPGLGPGNFQVTEQSSLESAPTVESPLDVQFLAGLGQLSVVLVIDRSGSMSGQKLADAKAAAVTFLQLLGPGESGAVIHFGSDVVVASGFTADKAVLESAVNGIVSSGNTALFDALYAALGECGKVGGVRAVIVFTDGQNNIWTRSLADVVQLSKQINVPVYTIGLGSGVDATQLQAIADQTGGLYRFAPQASDLQAIYADLGKLARDQYLAVYTTHNPSFDSTTRTVVVSVTAPGGADSDSRTYSVGGSRGAPMIANVRVLANNVEVPAGSSVPSGQALEITATITDDAAVQEAKLFYRTSGSNGAFTSVTMQNTTGTVFSGLVPGGAVQSPGLDYYLSATDGTLTTTSPINTPTLLPHQLGVLPNHIPQITHAPITSSPAGQAIAVEAAIVDTDPGDSVAEAWLYYRKGGHVLYNRVPMIQGTGNVFTATIPAVDVTTAGVDYYLVGVDSFGVRAYSGTDVIPHSVVVGGVSGKAVRIVPWMPRSTSDYSTVMSGGTVYRYFRIEDLQGNPVKTAIITIKSNYLDPGDSATSTSDSDGVFGVWARADRIGTPGRTYSVQAIDGITVAGQAAQVDLEPARFTVAIQPLEYSQTWKSMHGFSVGVSVGKQVAAGVVSLKGATLGLNGGMSFATELGYQHIGGADALVIERKFAGTLGAKVEFAKAKLLGGDLQLGPSVGASLTSYQRQRFEVPDPFASGSASSRDLQAVFFWDTLVTEGLIAFPLAVPLLKCIIMLAYADFQPELFASELGLGTTFEVAGEAGFTLQSVTGSHFRVRLPSVGLTYRGNGEIVSAADEKRFTVGVEFGSSVDLSFGLEFTRGWARDTRVKDVFGLDLTFGSATIFLGTCEVSAVDRVDPADPDYLELSLGFERNADQLASFRESRPNGEIALQKHTKTVTIKCPLSWPGAPLELTDLLQYSAAPSGATTVAALLAPAGVMAGVAKAGAAAILDDLGPVIRITQTDARVTKIGFSIDVAFLVGIEISAELEWVESRTYPYAAGILANRPPWIYLSERYTTPPANWLEKTAIANSLGANLGNLARRAWARFAAVLGYVKEKVGETIRGAVEFGKAAVSAVEDGYHMVVEGGKHVFEGAVVEVTKLGTSAKEFFSGILGGSSFASAVPRSSVSAADVTSERRERFVSNGIIISITDPNGESVSSFLSAVELVLTYTDDQLAGAGLSAEDKDRLCVLHWDGRERKWVPLQSTSEPERNRVSSAVREAGIYCVGLIEEANEPPVITLVGPRSGDVLTGKTAEIAWIANDPDDPQSALVIKIEVARGGGGTWSQLAENEPNDGVYTWDISQVPAGRYELRITVHDPHGLSASARSGEFGIAGLGEAAAAVAPNPVGSAGTSFLYRLPPGTQRAALMIFSIAGRLVFETSLDVAGNRFPTHGWWRPVDNYGVALSNGPYLYVVIADGKVVGRGKMVIER